MDNKIKISNTIVVFFVLLGCIMLFSLYVYVGTYVLPIAPYWVTQLPPNPPKPEIKHGEFDFTLQYEINGEKKTISDVFICDFLGFEVVELGGNKTRKWEGYLKNEQNREVFYFRNDTSKKTKIVLENIEQYKVVLSMKSPEYYMNEIDFRYEDQEPDVQVYNTQTEYYLYPAQCDEILKSYNFKIVDWICDAPIQNSFR